MQPGKSENTDGRDLYADIIIDISTEKLDRTFQYIIPEEMRGKVSPGMVVEVPFGKADRLTKAYVVSTGTTANIDPGKLKSIGRVITDGLGEEERLVALAAAIRDRYGSTMAQALRTVIPVRKKIRTKENMTLRLAVSREEGMQLLERLRRKNQKARVRLLETLLEEPEVPFDLVRDKRNITLACVRTMQEQGIVQVSVSSVYRNPIRMDVSGENQVVLTPAQQAIVDTIRENWDKDPVKNGRYLIQGVTGSGKTAVYMELIAHAIEKGQQAIMLIPEIALTWQTVLRFCRRFGDRVSFIHSRLSDGERYDQFERAKNGQIDIMIGPRSALFTPFSHLGIIVIDEEQEGAYQSENVPRYHAREVAGMRADREGAQLVLGSATPSLEARYAAECGQYRLMRLDQRINGSKMPGVEVVDLREELRNGQRSIISRALHERMSMTLEKNEQIMLFINRRGYAGFVSCRSCGEVIKCPHCDVSLTLHASGKMICHYCGFTQDSVKECPSCRSPFIRTFRAGTQQIEEEVKRQFPSANVLRMDLDTTAKKDDHEKILSAFAGHEADILIGTQMIVKGHDFPDVTLVGILAADLSLYAPDYRASERTFQLLTQAAGRAGRASREGHVIIQTYSPEHYAVECSAAQDYDTFYEKEISLRMMAGYPPAGAMTAIHMNGQDEAQLDLAAQYLKRFMEMVLKSMGKRTMVPVQIMGPSDEAIAKIQDRYRKVIYLKSDDRMIVQKIRQKAEEYIAMNQGFSQLQITFETM